jgi:F-type H+-transporting ATPase subunit epsilon
MRLRIQTPTQVEVDQQVDIVTADGKDGSFALLPRHVDLVAPLRRGLVGFRSGPDETFVAVDGGTLVKCGTTVSVSTPRLVRGPTLEELERAVEESFRRLEAHEVIARSALARLESDIIRRFVELADHD